MVSLQTPTELNAVFTFRKVGHPVEILHKTELSIHVVGSTVYAYARECGLNSESTTLEPVQRQHDFIAFSVIAQYYSSATLLYYCAFISVRNKIGVRFEMLFFQLC
jgi:hypothetical protein